MSDVILHMCTIFGADTVIPIGGVLKCISTRVFLDGNFAESIILRGEEGLRDFPLRSIDSGPTTCNINRA